MTNLGKTLRCASIRTILSLAALLPILSSCATDAQEVPPAQEPPYALGVTTSAGATLAVLGAVEGVGEDVHSAAAAALEMLGAELESVGLGPDDLVRVRAALAPGNGSEFDAWTAAWNAYFEGMSPPARTTVGSSGLPGEALITLDAVAAFPSPPASPLAVEGSRETPNPSVAMAGDPDRPIAIVSTAGGLFLSSGALPGRDLPDPESLEAHIRSSLASLGESLEAHGLEWDDVFFVRNMPTPQPDHPTPDFPAWEPVYADLAEMAGGEAPAYSLWGAPGFGSSGRYSEIEVWAALDESYPEFELSPLPGTNPLLRMTGSERGSIASGAVIDGEAELLWLSGVIAPEGTSPEGEAAAALAEMKSRLDAMGAGMPDVAELRVYRVDDGSGVDFGGAWNEAYGAEFNNPDTNAHKPVRTNYLVESLPGGRHVEVEAVVVMPPMEP